MKGQVVFVDPHTSLFLLSYSPTFLLSYSPTLLLSCPPPYGGSRSLITLKRNKVAYYGALVSELAPSPLTGTERLSKGFSRQARKSLRVRAN